MNKTIILSLIFHIAVAAAFLILSAIQVKFIRLKPANAIGEICQPASEG